MRRARESTCCAGSRPSRAAPVVLISGFGTLETAIEAVRAGAFDYISKPFVIADVKRIVDRALEQGDAAGRAGRRDARQPGRKPHRTHGADAGGVQTGRARGGLVGAGAHRRRKRRRARSWWPGRSTSHGGARAGAVRRPSIAERSPTRCSSPSCSAISVGRSRARWRITRACSSRPARARCCSMRSAIRRRPCRFASCASSRRERSGRSAPAVR